VGGASIYPVLYIPNICNPSKVLEVITSKYKKKINTN